MGRRDLRTDWREAARYSGGSFSRKLPDKEDDEEEEEIKLTTGGVGDFRLMRGILEVRDSARWAQGEDESNQRREGDGMGERIDIGERGQN